MRDTKNRYCMRAIDLSRRVTKQVKSLPLPVKKTLIALLRSLEAKDNEIRLIEVVYVGTHEKAAY